MTRVLILGAAGQISTWVVNDLQQASTIELTLFVRDASKLPQSLPANAKIVEGDVLDQELLLQAMSGQDLVYANLFGQMDVMAESIVKAMEKQSVKRLIFVSSLGIYGELPGKFAEWNDNQIGQYLGPYRKAADIIEASSLDYTVLRPAWLTDYDEVDYETTARDQVFKGTEVSRKSVASLVLSIIQAPKQYSKSNIGINKPNTEGDKPAFM